MLVWKLFWLVFCCSEAPVSMVFKLLLFFRPSLYFEGLIYLKIHIAFINSWRISYKQCILIIFAPTFPLPPLRSTLYPHHSPISYHHFIFYNPQSLISASLVFVAVGPSTWAQSTYFILPLSRAPMVIGGIYPNQ